MVISTKGEHNRGKGGTGTVKEIGRGSSQIGRSIMKFVEVVIRAELGYLVGVVDVGVHAVVLVQLFL